MAKGEAPALRDRVASGPAARLGRLLRTYALPVQIGVAALLVVFFALAAVVQNRGKIGARQNSSVFVVPVEKVPLRRQLVVDPSFETGVESGLPLGFSSLARTRSHAKLGKAALRVARSGSTTTRYGVYASYRGKAKAGQVYTASAWLRGDPTTYGKPVELLVRARGGAHTPETVSRSVIRFTPGWQRLVTRGVVRHRGRIEVDAEVVAVADIAFGDRFYLDGLRLVRTR